MPGLVDKYKAAKIAVIIPAYRAESTISKVINDIPDSVQWIIVVDDCSPDHTSKLVSDMTDSRILLIKHETNQGVGGAMWTGYLAALEVGANIIVKMDSDDQMDAKYLTKLTDPIIEGCADYTKGNRFLHLSHINSMPFIRRLGNISLSFLTKMATGYWNIFDPTNGYTAIHRDVINLFVENKINLDRRYFFEINMLIELSLLRAVVTDIYIPARYDNEISSLSIPKILFEFPVKIIKGCLKRLLISYYVRDFGAFSLFLITGFIFVLFGGCFGLYNWIHNSMMQTPTLAGTVMVAVVPFILGVQLLLQALVLDIQNLPRISIHK